MRVREEGVNLKRRSSRGSALGADGPAAGESRLSPGGSLVWEMGRGRPRPGRYLLVSEALGGELGREAGLAEGGVRGRPSGPSAAQREHSTKQSRNKAGNTCALRMSLFTPRFALTRG